MAPTRAPLPPPGTNFISKIRPSVIDILVSHTFTALYVPLFIALLWFSSKPSRRQPSFVLNSLSLGLAFSVGVLVDCLAVRAILHPLNPPPVTWSIAIGILGIIQSILVDTILLIRLFAVFPWKCTSPSLRTLVFTPPTILKLARVANLIAYIIILVQAENHPATIGSLIRAPYLKVEWFLQLADNIFASSLFLWKLHPHINSGSFSHKLKTLFYIAATNFVFPVIFSLIQLIFVWRSPDTVAINAIVQVNTSVAVIGVVFATVWAGAGRRDDERTQQQEQLETNAAVYKRNMIRMLDIKAADTVDPTTTRDSSTECAIGLNPVPQGRERHYRLRTESSDMPIFVHPRMGAEKDYY